MSGYERSRPNECLPIGQVNAHLGDELMVRVGVPHKSGSLAFHAFNQDYPAMVSASAFWNASKGEFTVPEASDLYECDWALDSAGFTAVKSWQQKGTQRGMAGIFPWTAAQYVEAASMLNPAWWSQPDLCVEREILRHPQDLAFRLNATATLLESTMRLVYEWQNELARSCNTAVVANLVRPPVPIIQGWDKQDYRYSLDLMMQVWERWMPWVSAPKLIGLGSVCRRTTSHPEHGLYSILSSLDGNLPAGAKLHLFGVKGTSLGEVKKLPWVASTDSMAFDVSARIAAHKERRSNTMAHRKSEMTRWMASAAKRASTQVGGQRELSLFA